jgi:hypothetical protein
VLVQLGHGIVYMRVRGLEPWGDKREGIATYSAGSVYVMGAVCGAWKAKCEYVLLLKYKAKEGRKGLVGLAGLYIR